VPAPRLATALGLAGRLLVKRDDLTGFTALTAAGSGGTLAGLLSGTVALGRPWRLADVSVSRPPEQVRQRVLDMAVGCARQLGTPAPGPGDAELADGRGPGHGIPSADGRRAARRALCAAGLVLDRSSSLSDSDHRPAGGRERSSAAWSGGHPRRPVAVFRHRAVAAAKPSGNPPSLTHIQREGAQGVALTPGSVRSRWCHTCPSAHLLAFNAQHHDITRTQYRVRELTIQ
jgi:hypothetical protein